MRRLFLALWFAQLGLLSACTIDCDLPGDDNPTQWLESCYGDEDCPGALTCQCGTCTLACEDDAICARAGDQPSSCVSTARHNCRDATSANVCLATCSEDSDCDGRLECPNGYCGSFGDLYEPPWGEPDANVQDAASDAEIEDAANDAARDASDDASGDANMSMPDDDADVATPDDDAG